MALSRVHVLSHGKDDDVVVHFHFQSDLLFPVLARLAEDEAYDGARGAFAAVSLAGAFPTRRMTGPGCPYEHSSLEGRVDGEDANEDTDRWYVIEVVRREDVSLAQGQVRGRGVGRKVLRRGDGAICAPRQGLLVGV